MQNIPTILMKYFYNIIYFYNRSRLVRLNNVFDFYEIFLLLFINYCYYIYIFPVDFKIKEVRSAILFKLPQKTWLLLIIHIHLCIRNNKCSVQCINNIFIVVILFLNFEIEIKNSASIYISCVFKTSIQVFCHRLLLHAHLHIKVMCKCTLVGKAVCLQIPNC